MPLTPVRSDATVGWYGKLPCAGDFVHRRLPFPVVDALDNWLRQGMGQLRASHQAEWREMYEQAPIWNCAIPSGASAGDTALVGLLAPSRDRVGREFPLCAVVPVPRGGDAQALLAGADDWLAALGRVVASARSTPTTIEAFDASVQAIALPSTAARLPSGGGDDILAILNDAADVPTVPMPLAHALPWPELPTQFDPEAETSYWWTNTGNGGPLRGFTSDAGLSPSLLLTLLRPVAMAGRAA